MAMTTAPAATQMVVREYDSDGPLTDLLMVLIGIDNLVAICLFVLLSHFAVISDATVGAVLVQLLVPLGVGALAGLLLAVLDPRLVAGPERQLLALSGIAVVVGVCDHLSVSSLPATLAAGALLVNVSPNRRRLFSDLQAVDFPLYVIFFALAGAELHLEAIPEMGVVGVGYILARSAGKLAGGRLGARAAQMDSGLRRWLGPAMLAQAGLAIGLARELAESWGAPGIQVQTVVLASVVIFEGLGPLLTRSALVNAGEVTVLGLLFQRSPVGVFEGLHEVVGHFREMIGLSRGHKLRTPRDIPVAHVMRRNVETVRHDCRFERVLKVLGHSRYDRLPVVGEDERLVGVIQYVDIAEVLVDPGLRGLVLAADIANPEHTLLRQNETVARAMEVLAEHPDHTYILVVDDNEPDRLVGVVRQNDLLSAQRKLGGRRGS